MQKGCHTSPALLTLFSKTCTGLLKRLHLLLIQFLVPLIHPRGLQFFMDLLVKKPPTQVQSVGKPWSLSININ